MDVIYKIFRPQEWVDFEKERVFAGSEHDRRDGFIHFCTRSQLQGTLDKHYGDETEAVIAAVSVDEVGLNLKWEVSRGGQKFPHLYAPLYYSALIRIDKLKQTHSGFDLAALGDDA